MRFALNRKALHGRQIITAQAIHVGQLVDQAQHGDTLHKISEPPESGADLVQLVDGQLSAGEYTSI